MLVKGGNRLHRLPGAHSASPRATRQLVQPPPLGEPLVNAPSVTSVTAPHGQSSKPFQLERSIEPRKYRNGF